MDNPTSIGYVDIEVVSSPLDDLCIDIWISAIIILSQHPDTRETGDSNVLI